MFKNAPTRLLCLSVLLIAAGHASRAAANPYSYSIVLPHPGQGRNLIYAFNSRSGQLEVSSYRLRHALDAAGAPATVLVNSISMGHGTHDYNGNWHGALLWSVAPGSQGIYPSDLFLEPPGDRRSDLFISPHQPQWFFEMNLKGVEENSANLPWPAHQLLATGELGIPGGITGQPNVANPGNLVGFDVRTVPSSGKVYFTISELFTSGGVTYRPSDVLYEEGGAITVWRNWTHLAIDIADRIDALDVDAFYHAHRGLDPSLLFSLSADSPTVVAARDGADLFHHVASGTGHTVHRTALAAAIVPGNSDIDSVVSIDPADELLFFSSASTSFDVLVEPTGEVQVSAGSAVSDLIVFWDFDLEPLDDQGCTASSLRPGDTVRIDAYGLVNGRWRAHHERIERAGDISHPMTELVATVAQGLSKFSLDPNVVTGSWEFVMDGESTLVPAGGVSYTTDLEPGAHVVQLHYRDATRRSDALRILHWVPARVAAPNGLSATPLPGYPTSYRLEWDPDPSGVDVAHVEIDGTMGHDEFSIVGPTWVTPPLPEGVHRIRVTRQEGAEQSVPVDLTVCVTDSMSAELMDSHEVIPGSGVAAAADAAYLDGSNELIVLDPSVPEQYRRYSINGRSFGAPTALGLFFNDSLRGVSAFPMPMVDAQDPATTWVQPGLIWAISPGTGVPVLVVTDADGGFIDGWTLSVTGTIEGIAYDDDRYRVLAIIDSQVHEISLPALDVGGGGTLGATPVASLSGLSAVGITLVESGHYEIACATTMNGEVGLLATVDATTDTLAGWIELDGPVDQVRGMVYAKHGAAARPQYFICAESTLWEYHGRDPRGVSPRLDNPFDSWTLFGDLDGDGASFTIDDAIMAYDALHGVTDPWTWPCTAAADFNQNGWFDQCDMTVFILGFQGSPPVQPCMPIVSTLPCDQPSCGP